MARFGPQRAVEMRSPDNLEKCISSEVDLDKYGSSMIDDDELEPEVSDGDDDMLEPPTTRPLIQYIQ